MGWNLAADIALLALGYWIVDRATRGDGLLQLAGAVGLRPRVGANGVPEVTGLAFGLAAALALVAPFWSWDHVPQGDVVRLLAGSITAFLAWQAVTKDKDPVFPDRFGACRVLLFGSTVASFWSPALLPLAAFLLTTPFALWQHHSTLPMRMLLAIVAFVGLASAAALVVPAEWGLFASSATLWWFLLVIQVSHYFITALAKMWLGPKWYSWVTDNRMHHLAASAYSWGWARFVPWSMWRRFIGVVKSVEKPMQAFGFGVELLAPLALLHPMAAVACCIGWALFHVGVLAVSGLLFWDWILADLVIAGAILMLPESVTGVAFGGWQALAGFVFMAVFPLRHKLWKPIPLGWWDTPFTQRMHWRAHGASGEVYGVYNNFMCPNERLYGKVHACFLAPARGITYHLGEIWKREVRDAIRAAGPDLEKLELIRDEFGVQPRSEAMADNHVAYLKRFFHAVNEGVSKKVLPRGLRWLKAPGDQLFYWGELPRFTGQEKVVKVSLHYREEYFDGDQLRRLCDDFVLDIPIDSSCADVACRPEPTPKEVDELLLEHAIGKLIDLPDFGGGYIGSDDGKKREAAPAADPS